jgi:hypothetical protein
MRLLSCIHTRLEKTPLGAPLPCHPPACNFTALRSNDPNTGLKLTYFNAGGCCEEFHIRLGPDTEDHTATLGEGDSSGLYPGGVNQSAGSHAHA